MPSWVAEGWREYVRRMPPHLSLELIEIPVRGSGRRKPDAGRALLERVPAGARTVALDPGGRPWSTRDLARNLEDWQTDGAPVAFLIGAADGLGDEVRKACSQHWSLGPLTLPHMLVRVLVAEQLYRAHTILANHPYHRG